MRISVVICTRNRAISLRRALASIAAMNVPADLDYEVIVIDNGSQDETSAVIASFQCSLPIRGVIEPQPGLSRARNRGVKEASGDYIVWTDDDVEVGGDWLSAYAEAFTRWPQAAVFGGKIVPVFEEPVPAWLSANMNLLERCFAARDLGDAEINLAIEQDLIPFGANYAVRSAEQRQFPYDVMLGAGSGSSAVGEETGAIKQMLRDGHTGKWVPSSKVLHHVARSRLTPRDIAKWFEGVGYAMQQESRSADPKIFGAPRWMWRDTVQTYAKYLASRLTRPTDVWIRDLARYAVSRGQLQFWRSLHKSNT